MDEPAAPQSAEVASQRAAVLETAGVRDAEALRAAGNREALILSSEGQRNVNLLWERTQRQVAIVVVSGVTAAHLLVVVAIVYLIVEDRATPVALAVMGGALGTLSSTMSLVIGFYFSRTNHQKIGGVGPNEVGR